MIRKDATHQVLGDLSESPRCRNRRRQRERARDRAQIGEAHADGDSLAGTGLGAEPGADAVGEMMERRFEDALDRRLLPERCLRAGGARTAVRLDLPRIAVPG
jgi:hypothetical protein